MDELFNQARIQIEALELKLDQLKQVSKAQDQQLIELGENVPIVWITGPQRGKVKTLLVEHAVEDDGVHPLRLDTKYYSADVFLSVSDSNELEERHHAIVLAFEDVFDAEMAEDAFSSSVGEVRICICNDHSAAEWCVNQGVEWIEWKDRFRVLESLSSTTWPNMVLKSNPRVLVHPSSTIHPPKRKELSEEEQLEILDQLMGQARELKNTAATLSDSERRRRAAEAAEQMIQFLGLEEDDEEE